MDYLLTAAAGFIAALAFLAAVGVTADTEVGIVFKTTVHVQEAAKVVSFYKGLEVRD